MTKRQLIDEIVSINRSAEPAFLAKFDDSQLTEYLQHLRVVQIPRIQRDPRRYDKYFANLTRRRSRSETKPNGTAATDVPRRHQDADVSQPVEPSEPQAAQVHNQPALAAVGRNEASGQDAELWLY